MTRTLDKQMTGPEHSEQSRTRRDLELLHKAVVEAGEIALRYFGKPKNNEVWLKGGKSPVSEADFAVNDHLLAALGKARPDYGWLSEETREDDADREMRLSSEFTFVVDPIDGTRGFIGGRPEWGISVAIVREGRPVVGALHCPALKRTYLAGKGVGASVNGTPLRPRQDDELPAKPRATGSRGVISVLEKKAGDQFEIVGFVPSLAYRLVRVAEGSLDAGFARGGASDWDIAAADLILSESGCKFTDLGGRVPGYNGHRTGNGPLAASPAGYHEAILDIAKRGKLLQ